MGGTYESYLTHNGEWWLFAVNHFLERKKVWDFLTSLFSRSTGLRVSLTMSTYKPTYINMYIKTFYVFGYIYTRIYLSGNVNI